MAFSSPWYLLFMAAALAAIGSARGRAGASRAVLAASLIYCAAWGWRDLAVLALVVALNGAAVHFIASSPGRRSARSWLWVAVASSLGPLVWFKGLGEALYGPGGRVGGGFLPVGISFYTFKALSLSVDTYRRVRPSPGAWLDRAAYLVSFPELVSGPITRASAFLRHREAGFAVTRHRVVAGGSIFLQGLTKKLLIADRAGAIADPIFADPGLYSTGTVWFALVAYAIQIYGDFSGYSDMAVGSARMFGYELPENFNMPYASASIGEFWRRWHMSLSSWFRDYVFLPLAFAAGRAADRSGLRPRAADLAAYAVASVLTMLLCGLWHGSAWTFVLWGGLHGGALAVERVWRAGRRRLGRMPTVAGWALTQAFVLVAWVPFRADSGATALLVLRKLAGVGGPGAAWFPGWLLWGVAALAVAHWIGGLVGSERGAKRLERVLTTLGWRVDRTSASGGYLVADRLTLAGAYVVASWILALFLFAPLDASPFLYARF